MTHGSKIICFRHCCPKSIFCKNVPRICPICKACISDYIIEPFLIPYPYTNAIHQPTTVAIRPSQGSFLNDYSVATDLHIGIVNSKGIVFEFDKGGLIINDHSKWTDCIALKIIPSSWDGHWDEFLKIMIKDPKWKSCNYNETTMNCFNFVIEFVNNLNYPNMRFINKEDLCDKLLLPKIQDALKYNSLFKNLESNDCFVAN